MVKVVITYVSAGAGHLKAARAIYDSIKENVKEIDIELVDALQKSNPLFRTGYVWGYAFLVKYALWAWLLAFRITYYKPLRRFVRLIASMIDQISSESFAKFLVQKNPDYIISTHFFPSEIISNLKVAVVPLTP